MPILLLFAAAFVIAAGQRSDWTTSAARAEEEERKRKQLGTPHVEGVTRRWFFWYVLPFGSTTYGMRGPEFLTDEEAFSLESRTRAASLGVQLFRFVYTSSGVWVFDTRTAPALLASRPITDASGNVVGAIALPKPITGTWPYAELPQVVFVNRKRFVKAKIQASKPGVIGQYREDVPENSQHLYVCSNGRYVIDHVDEANPDHGRMLEHFLKDFVRPMRVA
jgi:hypothetical protein